MKEPSRAQVKQRHKFMLTGTMASMISRLNGILLDKMIPNGSFKFQIMSARNELVEASKYLKNTPILYKEEEGG